MDGKLYGLVIDDDPVVREFVADALADAGWQVETADSAERAFELLAARRWALVFCDVRMGGADGFAVLKRFTEEVPAARFILMTGHASAVGALDATAYGAHDYLIKPVSLEEIQSVAGETASQLAASVPARDDEAVEPAEPVGPVEVSDLGLVGVGRAFIDVMKLVGKVAPTNLPVLITGESGTGKEVVAQAIHKRSRRAGGPFVAVNCGALSAELIESELFGHVAGAFTGADRERVGLIESAHGGTILLDEVTETSLGFQVKLLRAVQSGEVRRVGSSRTIHVDVRVLAATNRDVEAEVAAKRFRQDLLYRLNAVSIRMPPLRERKEDVMTLARHFARAVRPASDGQGEIRFSHEAVRLLEDYLWPGNVRELENAVEHAVALADGVVKPEHLPERVRTYVGLVERVVVQHSQPAGVEEEFITMQELQERYLRKVLAHTKGNKAAAAKLLKIDHKTIRSMCLRWNVNVEDYSQ